MSVSPSPKGLKIVIVMCFGIFLCMVDTTIMNIALPAIQTDLNTTLEQMSWVLNIYTMVIAVCSIPLGRLADQLGREKVYLCALIIFATGSVLCACAQSGGFLIFSRFVQSIGAAILFPTSMVIGVSAVPIAKRDTALAILGVTQGFSAAIGPAIGGLITNSLGWRYVFYVNLPVCLLAVILCWVVFDWKKVRGISKRIDWFGLVTSSAAIAAVTLALIKGNDWGWGSWSVRLCFAAGLAASAAFIWIEKRAEVPMVNLELFRDRSFAGASAAALLSNVFLIGVTVLLPTFLTRLQGKTELEAAFMITPISAMIFVFSPLSVFIMKKAGKIGVIFSGFLLMAAAYGVFAQIHSHVGTWFIILPCLILGIGYGLIAGPITVLSASTFEGELLTASQSVVSMLRQIGVVLAVAIFVSLLTTNIKNGEADVNLYATKQLAKVSLSAGQKQAILGQVKETIRQNSIGQTSRNHIASPSALISENQKDAIIHKQVAAALKTVPARYRDARREAVEQKVSHTVNQQLAEIKKEMSDYQRSVEKQSKATFTASFAKIYHFFFPVLIICSLTGMIFYERKAAKAGRSRTFKVDE